MSRSQTFADSPMTATVEQLRDAFGCKGRLEKHAAELRRSRDRAWSRGKHLEERVECLEEQKKSLEAVFAGGRVEGS